MIKYRILAALLFALSISSASAQRFVNSYNTIAEMLASPSLNTAATNINVLGYRTPNDGGGGQFWYDKNSTTNADGGTVFVPTVLAAGRVHRVHDPRVIHAKWFGVTGPMLYQQTPLTEPGPDESPFIDNVMAYASNHLNITVKFGPGDYMISRTVFVPMATFVEGENPVTWFDTGGARTVNGYMFTHNHTSTRFYPTTNFIGPMFSFTTTNSPLSIIPLRSGLFLNPLLAPYSNDGSRYTIYGFGSGLRNLQIDGTVNQSRDISGIFIDQAGSVLIDNVDVFQTKGWSIWVEGTYDTQVHNSRFMGSENSYGVGMFKRMQDGKIQNNYFAGGICWFEDCGENIYMGNTFFNNYEKIPDKTIWTNVTTTAGSDIFTTITTNVSNFLRTPWPIVFTNSAPAGFDTNNTYWVSRIDDFNFKLSRLPGYVGQVDSNGVPTGARNGVGITNTQSGTWILCGSPQTLIYNRNCAHGIWDGNRIDQSVNNAIILSGPNCFENTFFGNAHLNMGISYQNPNFQHITTNEIWYAAYVLKDRTYKNSMIDAQVGADLFQLPPQFKHSIGWVINDFCDYNIIGGGNRASLSTNYMIGALGTAHTEIQFEQATGSAAPPIRQSLQKGLFFNGSAALPPRITGDIGTVLIGTNDFTMAANVTYPELGRFSGVFAISPLSTSESGPYSWAVRASGTDGIAIYKRDSAGSASSTNTDAIAYYYSKPDASYNMRDMWFCVARRGSNIVFTLDGRTMTAIASTGTGSMADTMAGGLTNYVQLGVASTSLSLNGRYNDFLMFNFAMDADEMNNLKSTPVETRWKDGAPYTNQTSGTLVLGMEYEILHYVAGDDFANCGGANVQNTIFTATNTVPTSWANSSALRHRGLIYWPNMELGYGRTFPEKTTNSATWASFNGVYHLIDVDTPPEFDIITPLDVPQPLQTGVRFERSATPRITTDLNTVSTVTIGTNDFTLGVKATYTTNSVATGFVAISPSPSDESGTNSFYMGLRADRIVEVTKRSTTGASTGTDSSSNYYVPNETRAGKSIWMIVTRQGSNVVAYADGVMLTPYIAVNQAGFADAFSPATNYIHWGMFSVSSCLDGIIRDGFMANFAMTQAQVSAVRTNAFPSRYLYGSWAVQTSGFLEAGCVYRILDIQGADNFTNVGASANANNVEFVALSRTPTTWASGSVLRKLGIVLWPDFGVGVGDEFHDFADPAHRTVGFTTGLHHNIPKKTGTIRFRTNTNGNKQLLSFATVVPALAIPTNARITDWTINSDGSGSATTSVDLGNASGGAQVASGVAIGTGRQDVGTFVSRYSTTGNLWVKANGDSLLDHTITYVVQE